MNLTRALSFLLVALLTAALSSRGLSAQTLPWQRIVDLPKAGELPPEPLTPAQRRALEKAILATSTNWDECGDERDWPHKITVHRVRLGPGHYTLAESGPGCLRGGQGSNGAMWLLRWHAGTPVVLGDLDGWFDAVVPTTSHGLHDVAVGWHNSAYEYGLALYRFNGRQYRAIADRTVRCGEESDRCSPLPVAKGR